MLQKLILTISVSSKQFIFRLKASQRDISWVAMGKCRINTDLLSSFAVNTRHPVYVFIQLK